MAEDTLGETEALRRQLGRERRARRQAEDIGEQITRKHYLAEQELLRSNDALRRANEELEQFAYVASHDLRAPLRAVENLAQWLRKDLDGALSGDSRAHMELLISRVKRMERLLDALLEYARVGGRPAQLETLEVAELVQEVIDLLAPLTDVTLDVASDLPALEAPRTALQQVFFNLIGNSIKHHDREQGRIQVSCVERDQDYEFCVADDGPGIAPEYHDKVFEIFQTLRRRDEVEGSGMGLSLVRKQVETGGGRVWIDSDGDRGTRVRFTWPRRWPASRA